jgi:hypothetical protein
MFALKNFSNWQNDNDHGFNWVRFLKSNEGSITGYFIGLNCISNLVISPNYNWNNYSDGLKSKTIDNKILRWSIFGSSMFYNIIECFNLSFNNPKYTIDQLDEAKNNIDNFILKFEKLKAFT